VRGCKLWHYAAYKQQYMEAYAHTFNGIAMWKGQDKCGAGLKSLDAAASAAAAAKKASSGYDAAAPPSLNLNHRCRLRCSAWGGVCQSCNTHILHEPGAYGRASFVLAMARPHPLIIPRPRHLPAPPPTAMPIPNPFRPGGWTRTWTTSFGTRSGA
jgi:hypothetical protein